MCTRSATRSWKPVWSTTAGLPSGGAPATTVAPYGSDNASLVVHAIVPPAAPCIARTGQTHIGTTCIASPNCAETARGPNVRVPALRLHWRLLGGRLLRARVLPSRVLSRRAFPPRQDGRAQCTAYVRRPSRRGHCARTMHIACVPLRTPRRSGKQRLCRRLHHLPSAQPRCPISPSSSTWRSPRRRLRGSSRSFAGSSATSRICTYPILRPRGAGHVGNNARVAHPVSGFTTQQSAALLAGGRGSYTQVSVAPSLRRILSPRAVPSALLHAMSVGLTQTMLVSAQTTPAYCTAWYLRFGKQPLPSSILPHSPHHDARPHP
ncbi:hypothetical protein FB451DRAFT_672034 [Mycena latifolia]|nr:hypothetical protein FB451DRAFT_672034 [Mycena latifolia]